MKYVDEYRNSKEAELFANAIRKSTTRPWTLMEICGGQTHSIAKYSLQDLLPETISLLHGPGCPVCVTPINLIDKAVHIAAQPNVIFCSFGDMLRVPGSKENLLTVKSKGGDLRIVYSPLDALKIAQDNPQKEVVFFAIGFETTAPANAMAIYKAKLDDINNISFLVSQVIVPPAIRSILGSSENRVQGFLAAGHVCTVMGYQEYEPISQQYRIPIVVTGFEPLDILQGIYLCVKQLEEGRAEVENQYSRSVRKEGNLSAQKIIQEVFQIVARHWRGIGEIAQSGLGLREAYAQFDAENKFPHEVHSQERSTECISGLVLQGIKKPNECQAFGKSCTPESPLGATMVSTEGACAAYYRYQSV
ncbi:MAG: hydrogenase formation protein HypD [Nitrospinae bacterium]|nr:hydrogenase formation protein HypD [Nitrospinota bacterium]MBL7021041.1 hydrogenase formation protein HypD [Nitrospinaceae bacterium]